MRRFEIGGQTRQHEIGGSCVVEALRLLAGAALNVVLLGFVINLWV